MLLILHSFRDKNLPRFFENCPSLSACELFCTTRYEFGVYYFFGTQCTNVGTMYTEKCFV